MKYAFIRAELSAYPLSVVCRVLGVTQSGYHAWDGRLPSLRQCERDRLCRDIRRVFDAHRGRYGAPRLCRVLRERQDYNGSLNRIQVLMRALGLRAKAGRKYKVTTDSAHALPVAPNLLAQDFSCDTSPGSSSHAKAPDQVWLSDITYLWTTEGWLYVCCVLDLFTRRIVGWSMASHMTSQLVLVALDMAYAKRHPARGLIFHSDRGSQYASGDARAWLSQRGLRPSMSGTGNCYDNAPMESFWHSLKVEETHGQNFATRDEAKHCVFAYIEGWYNTTRMHSSLGYQSPAQFERACVETLNAANDEPMNQNSHTAWLNKKAA